MDILKAVVFTYCILGLSNCSITLKEDIEFKLKNISPLILTPYIESGNIEEARKLAEVKYTETEGTKSYAGYFTVNKDFNSNLFFWFFPSETDYENDPVVLWLQGGPGVSSLLYQKLSSMDILKAVVFTYCILGLSNCSITLKEDIEFKLKNTSPLILTPYIESGNIEEARKLAEVKYTETEGTKSYAGYFTVNKDFNSNLFFWFFPSETDYENDPVVLWLQGGPGVSSYWYQKLSSMDILKAVVFTYCILGLSNCSITLKEDIEFKLKNISPLILTPYIESGNIEEARKLAEVKYTETEGTKSYAGYFTVNKDFNSNLFFWFFPSETDYENDPVVLWLQGGPGVSSLLGALAINGAYEATDDIKLKKKTHYWSQAHSVLYIDSPVGTGFSFTDEGGYVTNQTAIGDHLYTALLQFFQLFPELQKNNFFAAGESYGGKHVPSVAYSITKNNPTAKQKINLKGLLIGNGHCDPENQMQFSELLYQLGLIDTHGKKLMEAKVEEVIELIHKNMWDEAYVAANRLIYGDCAEPTLFTNLTGFTNYYNILYINDTAGDNMRKYVDLPEFRAAVHVGNVTFDDGEKVLKTLSADFLKSMAHVVAELLNEYKILFYNGQLDIILAHPVNLHFLQKLKFKDAESYKSAERHIWMIDGDVAGYIKEAGNIIELMVRNSGHMVPMNQPKWAQDMITRFTRNQPFY
ncbi:hypothetical protein FQR65_LT14304 [Abscondita terminalis]|nr:hypothetical protein FQR65_LT14304 [Abscondita terminalis]